MTFAVESVITGVISARRFSVRRFLPQVFAAFAASLFAISDGMSYGWTSPMVPYLISNRSHIETTIEEAEWLGSAFLYGSLAGLPITLFCVDKFGRKRSLIFSVTSSLIAWLLIAFGNSMIYLFCARFISGLASDMAFISCPMYISEISDPSIRGFLSGIIMIMDHIGALLVYTLGPYTPFYVASITGSTIVIIVMILLQFIPESPYYLIANNKDKEARKALMFFKSYADIDNEFSNISEMVGSHEHKIGIIKDIFTVNIHRKALFIIIFINLIPQLLGYTTILMSLHLILESAGSIFVNSSEAGILYGTIMLIATIFCSLSVDKFGRKVLLVSSATVSGLCVFILALYFHFKAMNFNMAYISWIPVASVMVFALSFKLGVGIVPLILSAEIAPASIKALGVAMGDGLMILGSLIAVQIYQFVTKVSGIYLPFYIYSISAVILVMFVVIFVPETKGVALDDIQRILEGREINQQNSITKDLADVRL